MIHVCTVAKSLLSCRSDRYYFAWYNLFNPDFLFFQITDYRYVGKYMYVNYRYVSKYMYVNYRYVSKYMYVNYIYVSKYMYVNYRYVSKYLYVYYDILFQTA